MDSRQVTLLTRGYLRGWLNFKYEQPLSRLREQLILKEVERDLLREVFELKVGMEASLLSSVVGRNKKAMDIPYDGLSEYSQLTLPYRYGKNTIAKTVGFDDREYWIKLLNDKKAAFEKEQKKK